MTVNKVVSKRVIFKRIRAVFILASLSLIGLRACSSVDESQAMLILRNQSESTVNFMQVKVNNKTFEIQNILPGQEQTWKFKPRNQNSFTVNGKLAAGIPIQASSLRSMATPSNKEHHLTIQDNGRISYSSPK
ncbi:hypothetical protein [Brunnivagina elsteri]|uniref:Uncharacterized protein n=1 Tax=Brunnivagina elsteri CCALA 953 TaxID=987040 RepID=A0A2A2TPF6_9CYAN|nr:hypothetical protein [Calothrix elsteri]PAX60330.1 hypothetical protein CK510_02495 [Calothrix elsteri CCALA 953]